MTAPSTLHQIVSMALWVVESASCVMFTFYSVKVSRMRSSTLRLDKNIHVDKLKHSVLACVASRMNHVSVSCHGHMVTSIGHDFCVKTALSPGGPYGATVI